MEKLVKRITTEIFNDTGNFKEIVVHYHYDTLEARTKHASEMLNNGYADSGQIMENLGSTMKPQYIYFGSYYKVERI